MKTTSQINAAIADVRSQIEALATLVILTSNKRAIEESVRVLKQDVEWLEKVIKSSSD